MLNREIETFLGFGTLKLTTLEANDSRKLTT